MSFEIITDDIENKSKDRGKKSKGKRKFNPMYLHIGVVVFIVLGLLIYLFMNVDFSMSDDSASEVILMVGDLANLNVNYTGNLSLYSKSFTLETSNGKFDVLSSDVDITGFGGFISIKNESVVLTGGAQKVEYGTSTLNLNGGSFSLVSKKKTTMEMFYPSLFLKFDSGRIKVDDDLNFEFSNTSILLTNYNFTYTYDGTSSFSGTASGFDLESLDPHLSVSYKND